MNLRNRRNMRSA